MYAYTYVEVKPRNLPFTKEIAQIRSLLELLAGLCTYNEQWQIQGGEGLGGSSPKAPKIPVKNTRVFFLQSPWLKPPTPGSATDDGVYYRYFQG